MNLNAVVLCEKLALSSLDSSAFPLLKPFQVDSTGRDKKEKLTYSTFNEVIQTSKEARLKETENKRTIKSKNSRKFYSKVPCGVSASGQMDTVYLCFMCDKYFVSKKGVVNHIRSHDNIKSFQCDSCPKMFLREKNLKKHTSEMHTEQLSCEHCGKKFSKTSATNYIRHKSTVHLFKCTECDMSFLTKTGLKQHSKIHPQNTFACSQCEMKFSVKSHLNRHNMMHATADLRLFRCSMCLEPFTGVKSLATHYRSHIVSSVSLKTESSSDDNKKEDKSKTRKCVVKKPQKPPQKQLKSGKPRRSSNTRLYNCYICDKCFTKKSKLVAHLRIHIGKKPFKCRVCERGYTSKDKFKSHKAVSHSYKCNKCCLKFAKKSHLKRHSKTHTDTREKATCGNSPRYKMRARKTVCYTNF